MAASVSGRPDFTPGKNAGVFFWQEPNGSWRVRLASGSQVQNFQGGISVTRPLALSSGAGIYNESADEVKQTFPGQLEFKFGVGGSDYLDGADFTVPAGAGLCLWGWGNLGKAAYVGAQGTRVSLPFDVFGTGACGTTTTPATATRKFHPGHYIGLNDWDGQAQMIQAVQPGVRGFLRRYPWRELEPVYGTYDFSRIDADLAIARDHGMQLVVMIEDKSFSLTDLMTPLYLRANFTLPYTAGGMVAKRWAPWVLERMGLLTRAMGARFDGDPAFEGVAFQESAMGFTDAIKKAQGYTPEKYRDALISLLTATSKDFPTSRVFWYMNYIEGKQAYVGDVAAAVAPLGVVLAGPDLLPDSYSLNTHVYPLYERFKDTSAPLAIAAQYDSFRHAHATTGYATKYWTMPELFRWARDKLHVDYLFWTRVPKADPADSYDWTAALTVIRNNPGFNQ